MCALHPLCLFASVDLAVMGKSLTDGEGMAPCVSCESAPVSQYSVLSVVLRQRSNAAMASSGNSSVMAFLRFSRGSASSS